MPFKIIKNVTPLQTINLQIEFINEKNSSLS